MPQLGILFDVQKLGMGFYGYTAFRILFSVVQPRDLAGCSLYHGEVGEGRNRPYCIAVESDNPSVLARIRHLFAASMARGLLPVEERFVDEAMLAEEVLALAARITRTGELVECHSRWLTEAWKRAVGEETTTIGPAKPASAGRNAAPAAAPFPSREPLALRWTPLGRKAAAYLVAFSIAGALVPWTGWGLALCAMFFVAGAIQAAALRLRLGAEESLSDEQLLREAKKLLAAKNGGAWSELQSAGAQASPLLRRVSATLRAVDLSSACQMAERQELADRAGWRAELGDILMHAWAAGGTSAVAMVAMFAFSGPEAAWRQAPGLTIAGLCAALLLVWIMGLLGIRAERLDARLKKMLVNDWFPALAARVGRGQSESLEQAMRQLSGEIRSLKEALERRQDAGFLQTIAELRSSIDRLAPVLAEFREPFVLQAVPANGRKAKSATA